MLCKEAVKGEASSPNLPQIHMAGDNGRTPGLLGLCALQDLDNVDVRITNDLSGLHGAILALDKVKVQQVSGAFLPASRPRSVKAGEMLAWWVTVRANKDLPGGTYTGLLEIVRSGQVAARLPLKVQVMALTLP